MSNGADSPQKEGNNSAINNAIIQLTREVVVLEDLLGEIQGQSTPPEVATADAKDVVPSLMETLNGTAGRIYKLTERITIAKNGIRESLF